MNWRRGLLLAGINVTVALPMILILAAQDAQWRRDLKQRSKSNETSWIASLPEFAETLPDAAQKQEEQTVMFSPCLLWGGHTPVHVAVVQAGNLPTEVIMQWQVACPPKWSFSSRLGIVDAALASEVNVQPMRRVNVALCLLIGIQWLLIGSFPLIKARRWWAEPGTFITLCTAIGSAIALIPFIGVFARLPVLIAFFGWLWYFALLLWIPVHHAWQSTLHGLRRLS